MRIQVRDTTLFFDVEGLKLAPEGPELAERPTLILLHGGPGFDHSSFKPSFSALRDAAQLVYLDHRGNGRSERDSEERWTLDEWADDLHAFCQALEIEKPVVLGQSFGGMVAMAYAIRHPEHPGKLILSSTTAKTRLDRVYATFERLGGEEARAAAEAYWSAPGPETLPDYARVCFPLYNTKPADPDTNKRTKWNFDVMFHFGGGEDLTMDLLPGLAKVQCPTLVLAGEDDPITPVGDAEDITAAIPDGHARLERFDGCGHGVFRDDPDAGFDAIRRFLLE
ncbi:MAG: alpha/beta hydrolase [Myxococcota bacterium]|nr:alpha/beta hydrolase [Myxococcota bacterium]